MSAGARAGGADGQAGFTLIEMLVALAIFAVIGAAGFAVLDQALRAQRQTDGRLERLAEIQRTMHVVTLDFAQARGGSLASAEGGAVGFRREGGGEGPATVGYGLEDGAFVRQLAAGGTAARQTLIAGVGALSWRFYRPDVGWTADWPPAGLIGAPRGNPAAVELSLTLDPPGLTGALRRVALLPAEAAP